MIGLVVATHSHLAQELINAAEMVIGPLQNARAVCVAREDGVESIRASLERAIDEVGRDGAGVAIMTDMFGGTPANISISFLEPGRVEVLTGVNLPMILKFFSNRETESLSDVVSLLAAYGRQSITAASDFLQK